MHEKVKNLLKKLSKKLEPVKKDIFSIVVHGSSVYSEDLKSHQDIDLFVILNEDSFDTLRRFKKMLKEFCIENSTTNSLIYYSLAGSGRVSMEKFASKEKQIFRLEMFVSTKDKFIIGWKNNIIFPKRLIENHKIVVGNEIKKFVDLTGDTEIKTSILNQFDTLQWVYCSVLEQGVDEQMLWGICQETVYSLIRTMLSLYDLKEARKDKMFEVFLNLFHEAKDFSSLFKKTQKLREGKKSEESIFTYLNEIQKLNSFVWGHVYEKVTAA
ncbi:nucleotidyltransferase domain-containing protein [Candidatus Pacearchaeota archaeon]|nr:nucleotidyltransferase domain-containing protein [Candidatus Pacearchaeota archaeon]